VEVAAALVAVVATALTVADDDVDDRSLPEAACTMVGNKSTSSSSAID
jgi:hypothetical protein